ncbi:hypothetical protein FA13DRAFT_1734788 [Coprinellus micaceus]|uniref:Uncharacterized protein n=1 Tax=Coprinellus micaceus TaxID=71717 RepID=A0A4Y7T5X6_COPMI|nr:hypothetical protein FA13DRAFT_1734788 [Coprinellus micaceus]
MEGVSEHSIIIPDIQSRQSRNLVEPMSTSPMKLDHWLVNPCSLAHAPGRKGRAGASRLKNSGSCTYEMRKARYLGMIHTHRTTGNLGIQARQCSQSQGGFDASIGHG